MPARFETSAMPIMSNAEHTIPIQMMHLDCVMLTASPNDHVHRTHKASPMPARLVRCECNTLGLHALFCRERIAELWRVHRCGHAIASGLSASPHLAPPPCGEHASVCGEQMQQGAEWRGHRRRGCIEHRSTRVRLPRTAREIRNIYMYARSFRRTLQ